MTKISLGQAVVLVAEGKVYCLEAVWEDMAYKAKERFRWAAHRGVEWIDDKTGAVSIPRTLTRGGRCGTHKGFSDEVRGAIKEPQVLAFGTVRPSQQSAGRVVVGGDPSSNTYCGTCGGVTEVSRQCSPNGSEFGGHELSEGGLASRQLRQESAKRDTRDETMADRQLREESIRKDTGPEDWINLRKDTMRRVVKTTCELEGGELAMVRSMEGSDRTIRGGVIKGEQEGISAELKARLEGITTDIREGKGETRRKLRNMDSKLKAQNEGIKRTMEEMRKSITTVLVALNIAKEDTRGI